MDLITQYIFSTVILGSVFGFFEAMMMVGTIGKEHVSDFWKHKYKYDIHIWLTCIRMLVYGFIMLSVFSTVKEMVFYIIPVMTGFSFWHDGFYYYTRKKIDGAYNGFFDKSTTTTAKFSFDIYGRSLLLLISLLIIIGYYIK